VAHDGRKPFQIRSGDVADGLGVPILGELAQLAPNARQRDPSALTAGHDAGLACGGGAGRLSAARQRKGSIRFGGERGEAAASAGGRTGWLLLPAYPPDQNRADA